MFWLFAATHVLCGAGILRRGSNGDLGRADRHGHVRRGRNNRHNEREHQKSLNDLDDDDNFSMRFQSLDEVVGQVHPSTPVLIASAPCSAACGN